MKIQLFTYLLFILGLCSSTKLYAQIEQNIEEADSIVNRNNQNEFQPLFFKALSERGIENYDKAVQTLEKLLKDHQYKPVLHFQLGLNYFDLEQYNSALIQLKKADSLKPDDFDIKETMFKVYEYQKQYEKAIEIAGVLAHESPKYYEILANIYLITQEHKKALNVLDKADLEQGFGVHKDQLRELIYKDYNKPGVAVKYYQNRIDLEPYNPMNAYRLMFFLINENQYNKALTQSKIALDRHPRFSRFYVLQVEIYLKLNQVDKAFMALETLVKNRFLEEKYKVQAIDTMKTYIETHSEFQDKFVQVLNVASERAEDASSFLDLGLYYFKTDKPKALDNFKKALTQNPQGFQIWRHIAVLQFQLGLYQDAVKTTDKALEIFPTQAIFMLVKGQSLIKLTQYNEAKRVLLEALSYLFEENETMLEVYASLSVVYKNLNEMEKAQSYQEKANKLKQKLKS